MGFRIGLGLLCALGSLELGCASRATDDGPLSLADACRALKQEECSAFLRCSPEHFGSRFPDLATCLSTGTAACVEHSSAPGSTVTPGQVAACTAARSRSGCDGVLRDQFRVALPQEPACVWLGTLPDGEACIDSSQCAAGTCSFYNNDACGTCLTQEDGSCLLSSECLPGSRCVAERCLVAGLAGEACTPETPCQAALSCRGGQCESPGQTGAPCGTDDTGRCAADFFCNQQSGLCEHSVLATAPGSCGVTESGSNVLCPAGFRCGPVGDMGEFRCLAVGGPGDLCTFDTDCGGGLECAESTCQAQKAAQCAASDSVPSARYPARLPSVPQGIAGTSKIVLAAPRVVLVSFAGDSAASSLEPFVAGLGDSSYWRSATAEYGIGTLRNAPPIRLNEQPPAELTDSDIQAWLDARI